MHSHLARILNANVQPVDGIAHTGAILASKNDERSSTSQTTGNLAPF